MDDDLIVGLTRQVKEEVLENYIMERRLIELQIEHVNSQADETRAYAWAAGKRLTRLSFLMIGPEMRVRLQEVLGVKTNHFWIACLSGNLPSKIRLIRARALTRKAKYRRILLESYSRLHEWMKKYRGQYEELAAECAAVNRNIHTFQRNFDLLAILNFFRALDMQGLEKKKILGDNFTAREMAELDKNLYIKPLAFEKLDVPDPIELPDPGIADGRLSRLADEVFQKYGEEIKKVLL